MDDGSAFDGCIVFPAIVSIGQFKQQASYHVAGVRILCRKDSCGIKRNLFYLWIAGTEKGRRDL